MNYELSNQNRWIKLTILDLQLSDYYLGMIIVCVFFFFNIIRVY